MLHDCRPPPYVDEYLRAYIRTCRCSSASRYAVVLICRVIFFSCSIKIYFPAFLQFQISIQLNRRFHFQLTLHIKVQDSDYSGPGGLFSESRCGERVNPKLRE